MELQIPNIHRKLTVMCMAFEPVLMRFRRKVFGSSNVLKIPKSKSSTGEYIPGSEKKFIANHYHFVIFYILQYIS